MRACLCTDNGEAIPRDELNIVRVIEGDDVPERH
jgi:hypothetical protein